LNRLAFDLDFYTCVWVMTITRRELETKVMGQGRGLGLGQGVELASMVTLSVCSQSSTEIEQFV